MRYPSTQVQKVAGVAQCACKTKELRRTAAVSNISSPFGENEGVVEEMYRKFRDDPSSVDPSWHEFLVDYNPEPTAQSTQETAGPADGQAAATPPQPKPAAAAQLSAETSAPAKPADAAGTAGAG